jgi:NADH-quinone oxidoreductase subunit J
MGRSPEHSSGPVQQVAAALIGAGTTALLAAVLLPALGGQALSTRAGDTQGIATQLFASWVWPFELLSVLLLVALIAALAVSRMPATSQEKTPAASAPSDVRTPA